MNIDRRRLLQYTGSACALALLPDEGRAATTWRRYRVLDAVALPRFAPGELVAIDTGIDRFTGDGLYLYPAWGQPRLYDVSATAGRLEFRNPGSGALLWTQSHNVDPAFAGRVQDQPDVAALAPLSVPTLTVTV